MNIKTIEAALKSPKTPMPLKRGLLKKYGKQLVGRVKDMGALSSTIRSSVGEVYSGNPKRTSGERVGRKKNPVRILKKGDYVRALASRQGLRTGTLYQIISHTSGSIVLEPVSNKGSRVDVAEWLSDYLQYVGHRDNPPKALHEGDIIQFSRDKTAKYMIIKVGKIVVWLQDINNGQKFSVSKKDIHKYKYKIIDRG